ncbi:hypothetical protein BCR35DRAFT_304602 [Leucosporidium creatinivorum]|uniref:Uncharacterized protein n=1 Tax=Leucosporidium creatinivorum TaxID=106004 RepID=A0A1Y2F7C0_9BASI|nr:hypothetical protein BCR35DRAFT_304602 [Leucosporidium creatinivorum]
MRRLRNLPLEEDPTRRPTFLALPKSETASPTPTPRWSMFAFTSFQSSASELAGHLTRRRLVR